MYTHGFIYAWYYVVWGHLIASHIPALTIVCFLWASIPLCPSDDCKLDLFLSLSKFFLNSWLFKILKDPIIDVLALCYNQPLLQSNYCSISKIYYNQWTKASRPGKTGLNWRGSFPLSLSGESFLIQYGKHSDLERQWPVPMRVFSAISLAFVYRKDWRRDKWPNKRDK